MSEGVSESASPSASESEPAPSSDLSPRAVRSDDPPAVSAPDEGASDSEARPVLWIALAVATSGLVYELLAGTAASWVLGDSVTQFSTVVGGYLAALGLGSYLSRFFERDLARRFVETELAVAVVGGLGTPLLFLLAGRPSLFRAALYLGVLACGCLVGLEIPLLLRVLALRQSFRTVIARVLAYDHAGSLAGSLLFAFVLMPLLGPLRGALVCGALNALVALYTTRVLRPSLSASATRGLRVTAAAILAVLAYTALRAHAIIDAVDTARA